jgi:hypothetical protein
MVPVAFVEAAHWSYKEQHSCTEEHGEVVHRYAE